MGVDQTSLDRIRNATFPSARRGYDKREVERFLARLADWLETGAGDESRSDAVKRELERVGQRTGAILSQAEESAQQIRAEAAEEATQTREDADGYAKEIRGDADAYAKETLSGADATAKATREQADGDAKRTIEQGQAQARRIVEEGSKRRADIESVIADLVSRRDDVLADIELLSAKLTTAVADHRPTGDDPFAEPESYDPLEAEEAEEADAPEAAGSEQDDELEAAAEEAEGTDELAGPVEGADDGEGDEEPPKGKGRGKRGSGRRSRAGKAKA